MVRNLVEEVSETLNDHVGRLAFILNEDEQTTELVVKTASDAIIRSLVEESATSGTETRLFQALGQFDGRILERLEQLLAGGNHVELLTRGNRLIGASFGASTETCRSVANNAGVSDKTATTTCQLVAPIVWDALGRQQRTERLDAQGVANLLRAQEKFLDNDVAAQAVDRSSRQSASELVSRGSSEVARPEEQVAASQQHTDATSTNWFLALLPLVLLAAIAVFAIRQANDFQNRAGAAIELPTDKATWL